MSDWVAKSQAASTRTESVIDKLIDLALTSGEKDITDVNKE